MPDITPLVAGEAREILGDDLGVASTMWVAFRSSAQ